MNENDVRIVRVTNIADFDFTSEMGARYGGTDFPLRAGESKLFPFTIGDHLAMHLARQIKLKAAPVRDASQIDGKGSDRPLWNDEDIALLKRQIMSDVQDETKEPVLTEGQRIAAKVEELNRVAETDQPAASYKDKAEVIDELKRRDIKFDARASKSTLEALLK